MATQKQRKVLESIIDRNNKLWFSCYDLRASMNACKDNKDEKLRHSVTRVMGVMIEVEYRLYSIMKKL